MHSLVIYMIIKNNGLNDEEKKDYLFSKIFNLANKDFLENITDWYQENYDNISYNEINFIYETMKISDFEFYNYLSDLLNQIGSSSVTDIVDLEFLTRNLELMYVARILVGDTINSITIKDNIKFLNETRKYFQK